MTTTEDPMLGMQVEAVDRPWGSYAVLADQPDDGFPVDPICAVKVLIVLPGQVLSLQTHADRSERWMALDPGCTATIGDQTELMIVGHLYDVHAGVPHRLANGSDRMVRLVEIMFGRYDEADIERLADEYGRC